GRAWTSSWRCRIRRNTRNCARSATNTRSCAPGPSKRCRNRSAFDVTCGAAARGGPAPYSGYFQTPDQNIVRPREETAMLKPVSLSAVAVALAATAWMLLPMPGQKAAAQSGPLFVNLVELDIVPAEMDKYMAAIKENGEAAVKEPGCREFNVAVSQKDPHHVVLFGVYD